MSPLMARMGWNPDSPTNALRVSLLAYLRAQLHRLEKRPKDATLDRLVAALESGEIEPEAAGEARTHRVLEEPDYAAKDLNNLKSWIAWLEGSEVST